MSLESSVIILAAIALAFAIFAAALAWGDLQTRDLRREVIPAYFANPAAAVIP